MAEIKIEKKKLIWPWILAGLIILAGALYFLYFQNNTGQKTSAVDDSLSMAKDKEVNMMVNSFTNYIESDTTMGLDHEFTHNALIKLADATELLAEKHDIDAQSDVNEAREFAEKITVEPLVTNHADNIKKATMLLDGVLSKIQVASFPDLDMEVKELILASEQIIDEELTLDQKGTVKTYFYKASELLKKMN